MSGLLSAEEKFSTTRIYRLKTFVINHIYIYVVLKTFVPYRGLCPSVPTRRSDQLVISSNSVPRHKIFFGISNSRF